MAEYTQAGLRVQPATRDDLGARTTAGRQDNPIPRKAGRQESRSSTASTSSRRTAPTIRCFGDMPEGNGDADLCLFPEKVTPNHHQLAREFVLLDNFYVEGEVSADGHEWTMGAYATDFVEKIWPLSYRGSPRRTVGYPQRRGVRRHRPAGGRLPVGPRAARRASATAATASGSPTARRTPTAPSRTARPTVKALEGHFDPKFRGYDLDYPDVKRAERFIEELKRFEKEGEMPRLTILRLPNDHTSGTAGRQADADGDGRRQRPGPRPWSSRRCRRASSGRRRRSS